MKLIELSRRVANDQRVNLPVKHVHTALKVAFEIIREEVKQGIVVHVPRFGKFLKRFRRTIQGEGFRVSFIAFTKSRWH